MLFSIVLIHCFLNFSGFSYLLYFFFILFYYLRFIALYPTFKHFYSSDSKQYLKVITFFIGLSSSNLFFALTCFLFLLCYLYFSPWYFLKIQALVLPYTNLLVILLTISFLAVFTIKSQLYLSFSSKFAVCLAIFDSLYISA